MVNSSSKLLQRSASSGVLLLLHSTLTAMAITATVLTRKQMKTCQRTKGTEGADAALLVAVQQLLQQQQQLQVKPLKVLLLVLAGAMLLSAEMRIRPRVVEQAKLCVFE
jgi:hypothetical protein